MDSALEMILRSQRIAKKKNKSNCNIEIITKEEHKKKHNG